MQEKQMLQNHTILYIMYERPTCWTECIDYIFILFFSNLVKLFKIEKDCQINKENVV